MLLVSYKINHRFRVTVLGRLGQHLATSKLSNLPEPGFFICQMGIIILAF